MVPSVAPAAVVGHSVAPILFVKSVPLTTSVSPIMTYTWTWKKASMVAALSKAPMTHWTVSEVIKSTLARNGSETHLPKKTLQVVLLEVSVSAEVAAAPPGALLSCSWMVLEVSSQVPRSVSAGTAGASALLEI